jgi:hypothetical protein
MFLEIAVTLNAENFTIAFGKYILLPNLRDIWCLSHAFMEELFCKLYYKIFIIIFSSYWKYAFDKFR